MPGPRTPLTLLALTAAALVPGCGEDDSPGRTETVEAARGVTVIAKEYDFDPETIIVQGDPAARGGLPITLKNEGALAHDLRVEQDGKEVGGTPIFQGGQSRTARVPLSPGKYEIVCSVGNHEDLGMRGSLEVK